MTQILSMQRVLLALGIIVFVGAAVVSATGAFFNDTETSTGNTFAAGSLDLRVDSVAHVNGLVCFQGEWTPEGNITWNSNTETLETLLTAEQIDAANTAYNTSNPANVPQAGSVCNGTWTLTDLGPTHKFFDFGDLKPGDNGENTVSIHVDNNDAYLCAAIHNVVNADNTCTEPEDGEVSEGCTVQNPENLTNGELGQELNFMVWDDDGDNVLEENEPILVQNANGNGVAGVYSLFTPPNVMPGDSTQFLGVAWCYGTWNQGSCNGAPVTNLSQTDSMTANVSFYVEQARNNGQFTCPSLERFQPPQPPS